ncbi:MAG: DUF1080 domain-containing protein [Marinilabiliales bacterium]|nr:DUF1080 domain-containing protein [Marinilabiliales bacterium]
MRRSGDPGPAAGRRRRALRRAGPLELDRHEGPAVEVGGPRRLHGVGRRRAGYVRTRQEFGSAQVHVEFATPSDVTGAGQGRGNSGVFLQGRYEVQVLDSYENKTYPDGQCGALLRPRGAARQRLLQARRSGRPTTSSTTARCSISPAR